MIISKEKVRIDIKKKKEKEGESFMFLPQEFKMRLEKMLGEKEFQEFIDSYDKESAHALRVNTLKADVTQFKENCPFTLKPVPWVSNGFYYGEEDRPGKHPYHDAGVYYIQEPSAMSVAALAAPQPGEKVLDLCAAPGGKTTQLAALMQGEGLLISNEIHPARAKILSQNVERMGIKNAVVTNEKPETLAKHFPLFFDKIVVDAPCSGEGMFKKEPQAAAHWSMDNIRLCARRQEEILEAAQSMLKAGGTLVYSTCTFAPEENEGSIGTFISKHPEFSIKKISACPLFASGHPEWGNGMEALKDTYRLWPHKLLGEGHYVAVLEKSGQEMQNEDFNAEKKPKKGKKSAKKTADTATEAVKLYRSFAKEVQKNPLDGEFLMFGEQLYLLPYPLELKGLKVLRPGLHLGTCKKNRFEPSHGLALALKPEEVLSSTNLDVNDKRVYDYLLGNTIPCEGKKGWHLLSVDGYTLGWGKVHNDILKNHYPKGLRWMTVK